jgi:hypothetical protein
MVEVQVTEQDVGDVLRRDAIHREALQEPAPQALSQHLIVAEADIYQDDLAVGATPHQEATEAHPEHAILAKEAAVGRPVCFARTRERHGRRYPDLAVDDGQDLIRSDTH